MSATARSWTQKPMDIGVPGPTPADMARAFLSIRADPLTFLVRVREQYGDLVAFPVPGAPAVLVNDPVDVRHVLQTNARRWSKHTAQYAALARMTGPGLLATSEPSWLTHRRAAAPAFHHSRLDAVGDQVLAATDTAIRSWAVPQEAGATGTTIDISSLALAISLDAVARALFSADLNEQAHDLLDASRDAARLVVRLGRAVVPVPPWLPTPANVQARAIRRRLDATSTHLIDERRSGSSARDGSSGADLLGLLMDSGLTDDQIRDELVTMIIAGHETVAAALSWTLMLLAEDQPAQDRLRTELTSCVDPVTMLDHRSRLPWTRAVVDEGLRLFPPAWVVSRRAVEPDVIGGLPVPVGTIVIVSPWLLHRRDDLWPDPSAFRPERFLGGRTERPGYLPFGQGPRLCIGREFALGEIVLVLSRLLEHHRVTVPPGWVRPRPAAQVAVHPEGGMRLVVTPVARASR